MNKFWAILKRVHYNYGLHLCEQPVLSALRLNVYLKDMTYMNKPENKSQTDEESYVFSKQIGHLLRRAYQRHVAIFQQTIPDSQLTAAQFVTMCAIKNKPMCSLSDIVKATAIDQATVRGIIERLKAKSLIEVSHDENDRRKVLVTLSTSGTELVDATVPFAERISQDTFGNLNSAERVAILYLLRKMSEIDDGGP